MKKTLFTFLFSVLTIPLFANHGLQALGALVPIFMGAGIIGLMIMISFFYSIYNIKKQRKTIRMWNIIFILPAIFFALVLFYTEFPLAGFFACFFILIKGIFIYLSFPNRES